MINSLWISKTGMEAQQMQLDVISNNLANVSTNGFKKSHAVFEDLMYQNLRQVGSNTSEQSTLPTGLQVGLGVRTVATSRNFSQGNLQQTSNNLDVAVQGNGFFQLTMPDGTIGYTRDGAFQIDSQGRMVNSSGLPLASSITVPSNATNVSVAADGKVTATIPGTTALQTIGTIHQPAWAGAKRPKHLRRICRVRATHRGGGQRQWTGLSDAGVCGNIQRQCGARVGHHDSDPACI